MTKVTGFLFYRIQPQFLRAINLTRYSSLRNQVLLTIPNGALLYIKDFLCNLATSKDDIIV